MLPGAEQFRDWIDRRFPLSHRKQRECAAFFDWDETFISQLLSGGRTPGLTNAVIIERETGIPAAAWVSSEMDKQEPVGAGRSRNRKHDKA